MSAPKVTVLLPVYNSGETLEETLASLWSQSYSDFEVLVVDDGSTDSTADVLTACTDPRLRVVKNEERLRLSGALNRGMKEARGELIARMDADDIALPHRLDLQVAYLEAHPEVVLCGTATKHFGGGVSKEERYPETPEGIRAFCLFNCPIAHPTVMFRRAVFEEQGYTYDGSFYPTEDFELWARVVHSQTCVNLPEVCLNYRVHEKSMTGADWDNMDLQAQRLIKEQFGRLGVEITDEAAKLHRDIGMARVTGSALEQARDHLVALLEQNRAKEFCTAEAFTTEVQDRWFHVCMNADGTARAKLFKDPGIWQGTSAPFSRVALVKASAWRRG